MDEYQEADQSFLPEHLTGLIDPEWALWRCVCLRGAGFPVTQVLQLAEPASAVAADELIHAENALQRAKNDALQALDGKLTVVDDEQHLALVKIIRAIRKNQVPPAFPTTASFCKELAAYFAARDHFLRSQLNFAHVFATGSLRVSQAIRAIACDERFREAITWQNRQAIHTGIASLLQQSPKNTHQAFKQRKHEALVANYLQRYCTKNDTIGFFGPVGLAKLVADGPTISVRPGTSLLAKRNVYFEGWCIDALAEMLVKEKPLRPWIAPRRLPQTHIEGTTLFLPFTKPITLSRDEAAVLSACDGSRIAKDLALDLIKSSSNNLQSQQEVYAILEQLSTMKRVSWSLEPSAEGAHPEQGLRQTFERIGDINLREECLAMLDMLETERNAVARSAGNAQQLDTALAHLEATFINLTEQNATRSAGMAYAARTLVYEDCLRNIDVALGPNFLLALSEPLTLLLTGARWLTYETARLYRQAFLEAFTELVQEAGSQTVDFTNFWLWVQPLLFDEDTRPINALIADFQQRWLQILGDRIQEDQQQVAYTSDELLMDVLTAFDAPGPGWRSACYHSPDVLIQASGPEAIRDGEYQLILGEFHIAMNTLQISAFLTQHPAPEEILRNAALDIPEPRILPVMSRQFFPISRIRPALITDKDFRLEYAADAYAAPDARVLPISTLLVERSGERLIVRTRDGRYRFDIIEVFAEFLSRLVYSCFKIASKDRHTPRITIDRLVVARESWCFAPAELPFAVEKDAAMRFIAARRFKQAHRLPRFVFVKVPSEPKPCFIDFDSPVYVDSLAKMVRHNLQTNPAEAIVQLSEMLPGPTEVWLSDVENRRYTSELRFVAVDLLLPTLDYNRTREASSIYQST
ncbi:MAG TPA: lantibiotic dehydratase [Ktedonobacteraceae bacterium]|nr:lantibiotic dehydratase [Ktedonobacteraceae bacterium]